MVPRQSGEGTVALVGRLGPLEAAGGPTAGAGGGEAMVRSSRRRRTNRRPPSAIVRPKTRQRKIIFRYIDIILARERRRRHVNILIFKIKKAFFPLFCALHQLRPMSQL